MSFSRVLASLSADAQPVQFGILAEDGRLLFANAAWAEFGRRLDSPVRPVDLGTAYLQRIRQADTDPATHIAETLEAVLVDGDDSAEATYACRVGGDEYRFIVRVNRFTLEDTAYAAVAHVDVTERERQDRDVRRFKQAIEAAGHAIFITDVDGEITYVNPAFERITGYSTSEALGADPNILNSGEMDEGYFTRLWETILDGRVWEDLVINRRKSGELYYAHQTIAPVLDDGEPIEFVALQTDITELRATRQGTEKLGRILRHDLRNQLSVAQSYAELIADEEGEAAEYAHKIVETISELLQTSEKGIELQRFLSQTPQPSSADIADVVNTVVTEARQSYPAADISYTGPETAVALCLTELETALGEVIENAIVHNDTDHPHVDLTVEATAEWVTVRIADNGPGVPEMEYAALDAAGSSLYHDTGFGLNLAYWIVRRSGGNVQFDSRDDGSVVTIRLPRPNT